MSRRQFDAFVEQAERENRAQRADDPDSWAGAEGDEWWQQARQKRRELLDR